MKKAVPLGDVSLAFAMDFFGLQTGAQTFLTTTTDIFLAVCYDLYPDIKRLSDM
jgi:hypothetical protein